MRFHSADVFLPGATDLYDTLRDEEMLEGTVIDFSDSGSRRNVFALVEIIERRTVIVPVEKLEQAGDGNPA